MKTIADLLDLAEISKLIVLSAGCLRKDNIVTGVRYCCAVSSIVQCPSGTLVLLKTGPLNEYDLCNILEQSAKTEISGLCLLGCKQFDMKKCKNLADKYSIPLLYCEDSVSLEELTRCIAYSLWDIPNKHDYIINKQEIPIEFMSEPNIPSLLTKLSEFLKCNIAYRDVINNRTYTSSLKNEFTEQVKTYPLCELQRLFKCHWVIDEKYRYGCLLLEENRIDSTNTIEAALLGLKLLFRSGLQDRITKKKDSIALFKEIIKGRINDQSTLLRRLRSIGIERDYPCITMIFEPERTIEMNNDYRMGLLISNIEKKIAPFFHDLSITQDKKEILCIAFLNDMPKNHSYFINGNIKNAIDFLNKELTLNINDDVPSFIGISDVRTSLLELNKSDFTARHALLYCKFNNIKGKPVYWSELGGFKILCSIAYSDESINLCNNLLKGLLDYDKLHNSGLVETLIELDKNNWNFKTTSEKLMFHQNTIKYRYRKICQLLDGDMNDYNYCSDIKMALKLHYIYTMSDNRRKVD